MYTAQLTTSLGFWGAHVSLQELMADLGGNDPHPPARVGVATTLALGGAVIATVATATLIAQGEARSGSRWDRPRQQPRPLPD